MSEVIVGKWGKNLAIRVPIEIARGLGLSDGEAVEIAAVDGDIHIRRHGAKAEARRKAEIAAEEIMANAQHRTLGGLSIRELREEGRRW